MRYFFELSTHPRSVLLDCGIYHKKNLRRTWEGIFYRLRIGCPWRDVPPIFGKWNHLFVQFNRWSKCGKLKAVFEQLSQDSDPEWSMMDGSIVKAHQHSCGAQKTQEAAIGKSVAGNSSKIHMLADSFGLPIYFNVTAGQVHDATQALDLIAHMPASAFGLADLGYIGESIRQAMIEKNITPVIPNKKNTLDPKEYDVDLYKIRHLIENLFARLKHFRAIATRFDKLKRNYMASLFLASIFLCLPL